MMKLITKKKVRLIEAYELDQNCVITQVVAYTLYLNGTNRDQGPTIFELVYHNTNVIGSPQVFLNAMNLALSQNIKYDFRQKEPLNDDLRTKLVKRKNLAKGFVVYQDSHRLNTKLHTLPIIRGLK